MVCAAEFQKLIKQRNSALDSQSQMNFRIGFNIGDVIIEGDNLYGNGINVAPKLEALCHLGGVCMCKGIHDFVIEGAVNREVEAEPTSKNASEER